MLSDDEITDMWVSASSTEADEMDLYAFARAVERAAYERAAALCGSPYSDETDDPYECGFNRAAEVIADAIQRLVEDTRSALAAKEE